MSFTKALFFVFPYKVGIFVVSKVLSEYYLKVKKENTSPVPQPPSLNVQRLNDRKEQQIK